MLEILDEHMQKNETRALSPTIPKKIFKMNQNFVLPSNIIKYTREAIGIYHTELRVNLRVVTPMQRNQREKNK